MHILYNMVFVCTLYIFIMLYMYLVHISFNKGLYLKLIGIVCMYMYMYIYVYDCILDSLLPTLYFTAIKLAASKAAVAGYRQQY